MLRDRPTHRLGRSCAALAFAAALAAPAGAQCSGADDALEPNDSCPEATVLSLPFSQSGLYVHRYDPDFYRVVVGPGDALDIEITFDDEEGDVDLTMYEPGPNCGSLWENFATGATNSDDERLYFFNDTGAPRTFVVMVHMWRGSLPECNTYTLTIDSALPSGDCAAGLHDDGLEENDDCATARPLPIGATVGLWADTSDEDYYSARVEPGATLDVTIQFSHADGDLDLVLYDAANCGTSVGSGQLAYSYSQTDDEQVAWTNTGSVARDVILRVDPYWGCNSYDMLVSLDGQGIGSSYCEGAVNSAGLRATLSARGSVVVADDDVVVEAHGLPTHTVGYFLCSQNRGLLPGVGGAQGTLCLGGDIGRFDTIVLDSGALGYFELRLPLGAMPLASGRRAVAPNESWFFQAWYRDGSTGGQTLSNLSGGLAIGFE